MKTIKIITFICVATWCSVGTAASFPCEKASNTLERTICSDSDLSKIDEEMAKYYNAIKGSLDTIRAQKLLGEQRAWLKKRLEKCQASDVLCLQTHYKLRIHELYVHYGDIEPVAIDEHDEDGLDFCSAYIQDGKPGIEWVPESPGNNDEIHKYIVNNKIIFYGDRVNAYYNIDIDDDGSLEKIVTGDGGSAQYRGIYIYDDNWVSKYEGDIGDNGAEYSGLFRYKKKIYIVWDLPFMQWSHPKLNFVSSFKKGVYSRVCKFEYRPGTKEAVEYSADKSLCEALLDNKGVYAQFKTAKTPPPEVCYESGGPECATPKNEITVIDINNDGIDDNVAKMDVSWGGGRGCAFTFLAITNDRGEIIQASSSNSALMTATQKWGDCGGAISLPFKYNGLWYIENKYPENNVFNYHEVLLLNDDKKEVICRYKVAREPYVVK